MSNNSNNPDFDPRASSWLDDDAEALAEKAAQLSEIEQVRIADLQLVDALLSNTSKGAKLEREGRVQRVMSAIDSPAVAPAVKPRFAKVRPALAIAATLLFALTLAWTQFNRESHAGVILRQIAAATSEGIDRVYTLSRDTVNQGNEPRIEGKLYLRGREALVLDCGDHVLGRRGTEYWFVPKQGDVLLAEDFQWMVAESERLAGELELLKQLSKNSARVPIMQLSSVVELMEDDYSVSLAPDDAEEDNQHTIVATLNRSGGNLPREISLTADATTSIIRRAVFRWESKNTLTLELAPFEAIPANWYTPEAHYDNERARRRVSRNSR